MDLKNSLKNRAYIFPSSSDFFEESPLDLIQNIFKNSKKLNIPNLDQIQFIDSNYNYDSYLIEFSDQPVCLKFSFDNKYDLLKRECDLLKETDGSFSPLVIDCDSIVYGNKINYSITTFEQLDSIKEIGKSDLFDSLNSFFNKLNILHNTQPPKDNITWFENIVLDNLDFEKNIPDDAKSLINQSYNYKIISSIFSDIILELKNLFKSKYLNKNEFCHGNLKTSNILNSYDEFKFINFENYFSGNKYFDIASLSINLFLNKELNRDFFEKYLFYNKINFSPIEWESYNNCYNIILRKTFLELLISFFIENIFLTQSRPSKLIELISLYSFNEENFYSIKSFKNNYTYINSIFSEIIIGSDTDE